MAQTVRIDEETHARLKRLADLEKVSLQEELGRAVRGREEELFFERLSAQLEARTEQERLEDDRETALWDTTLGDGLDELDAERGAEARS